MKHLVAEITRRYCMPAGRLSSYESKTAASMMIMAVFYEFSQTEYTVDKLVDKPVNIKRSKVIQVLSTAHRQATFILSVKLSPEEMDYKYMISIANNKLSTKYYYLNNSSNKFFI